MKITNSLKILKPHVFETYLWVGLLRNSLINSYPEARKLWSEFLCKLHKVFTLKSFHSVSPAHVTLFLWQNYSRTFIKRFRISTQPPVSRQQKLSATVVVLLLLKSTTESVRHCCNLSPQILRIGIKFINAFTLSHTKKRENLVNGSKNYVFIHKNSFIVPYFLLFVVYTFIFPHLFLYKYGIAFVDFIPLLLQLDFCEFYFHSHAFMFAFGSSFLSSLMFISNGAKLQQNNIFIHLNVMCAS